MPYALFCFTKRGFRVRLANVLGRITVHIAFSDEGALTLAVTDVGEETCSLSVPRAVIGSCCDAMAEKVCDHILIDTGRIPRIRETGFDWEGHLIQPVENV